MGQTRLAQGQISEAEAWLDRAIAPTRELGNPPQYWQTAIALGDLYTHSELTQPAFAAYREALTTIEQTAAKLTSHPLTVALLSFPLIESLRVTLHGPEFDK